MEHDPEDTSDGTGGLLEGLRIVESARGISGPYCCKLLADLGAEVIKIEPPGAGDPARRIAPFYHDEPSPDSGLLFNYLNTNKLGVTLDLQTPLGKDLLRRLLADADVFLFGGEVRQMEAQGLEYGALAPTNPRLVGVYVTPFGLEGARARHRSSELVSFHMSGLGLVTPGEKGTPKDLPPLKAGGHQALMIAGLSAAAATLHALFARESTGRSQRVDVTEIEPVASFQFMEMARWVYAGDPGNRGLRDFGQRVRCKDGEFNLTFGQDHMWQAWVEVMGAPDWARRPEYATRAGRTERQDEIVALIEEWAASHTKEEIYRLGQARRVPVFPLNSIGDAVESPQVQSRGFLKQLPLASGASVPAPSAPYQFSGASWSVRQPAPRLGQHNREVFCGRLGLPAETLAAAYEAEII